MPATNPEPSPIVVVVGVDMSGVSQHLLEQTHALVRPVDAAEIHVVHVVHPEPLPQRVVRPRDAREDGVRHRVEYARWALDRLAASMRDAGRRVFVHVPVGDAAAELARVAADVRADLLVVEAHDHETHGVERVFRRPLVARIVRLAPCTVLTIRKPHTLDAAYGSRTAPSRGPRTRTLASAPHVSHA